MEPLLWLIIIGGIFGWLAGEITGKGLPWGLLGNVIAGMIGAWLGVKLLGPVGPQLAGVYIIPALIGSVLVLLIASWIMKNKRR